MPAENYDFAVVGAGPAGLVAAARLAAAGARAVLIDAGAARSFKAGEHLPAAARAALDRLALLPSDWDRLHLDLPGFVNRWGQVEPIETSRICAPGKPALALDRPGFERQLQQAARRRGVVLMPGWKARLEEGANDGMWTLLLRRGDQAKEARAAHLLLATGRNARVPARLAMRLRFDRLGFLACQFGGAGSDRRPSIECFEHGWAFCITAPGPSLIVYLFFDASRGLPCARSPVALRRLLACCPLAAASIDQARAASQAAQRWYAGPAHSSLTFPAVGGNWSLVGDAAQSYDPLSSMGLLTAIQQGAAVADRLLRRDWNPAGAMALENSRLAAFEDYLARRRAYYQGQPEWPNSPFWRTAASAFDSPRMPPQAAGSSLIAAGQAAARRANQRGIDGPGSTPHPPADA